MCFASLKQLLVKFEYTQIRQQSHEHQEYSHRQSRLKDTTEAENHIARRRKSQVERITRGERS